MERTRLPLQGRVHRVHRCDIRARSSLSLMTFQKQAVELMTRIRSNASTFR